MYAVGSNVLSVVRDDGIGARDILLKAENFQKTGFLDYPKEAQKRYWEDSWRIPFLLGYVSLFDLNDIPTAAQEFRISATHSNVPAFIPRLALKLSTRQGQFEAGLSLVDHMLSGTPGRDPLVAEKLRQKKQSLEVGFYVFQVREEFEVFSRFHQKPGSTREQIWRDFKLSTGYGRDPWGGELATDPAGKIGTSTPHQNVFGLD